MDQTLHIRSLSVEFDHTLQGEDRGGTVVFELFGRDRDGKDQRIALIPVRVEMLSEDPDSTSADGLLRNAEARMRSHLKQLREDLTVYPN